MMRGMAKQDTHPADPLPSFDSSEQQVYLHLWRTYDCLKTIEDQVFSRYSLSAQQYNALRLLQAAFPAPTQTMELGRRLISRMPDTTRMLDRLEKQHLVTRIRLPENRRVVQVLITEHGQQLLREMAAAVCEMHQQQLGHLSDNQQQQLVRLLKAARKPHEDATCDWLDH